MDVGFCRALWHDVYPNVNRCFRPQCEGRPRSPCGHLSSATAVGANAIQYHRVRANPELRRDERSQILHAARNVEDAVAVLTLKVVVVLLVCPFVARRLAGNLDGFNPPFLQERTDRAINGCNAEAVDAPGSLLKQLANA